MDIIKKTSTTHTGYLKNRSIQYIVLHYTAGTSSAKGVARNIAAMFANPNNRPASADFIVDDGEIVQYNPNIKDRYTYAVGGKPYSVKYTPLACTFYGKCKNHNSISIEMCSSKVNKKSLQATDTDWSISASVVDRAVELTKYLMKTYNVPADRVIMHHHVTGKLCPQPWCVNPRRLDGWNKFKERLTGKKKEVEDLTKQETEKLIAEKLAVIEKKLDGIKPKAYNTEQEIPEWYKDAYLKVKPVLKGRAEGKLDLSEDLLRILTLMDRFGILPND
jgi:N-acetylmuramoyl-L-alanine amidase CwlA